MKGIKYISNCVPGVQNDEMKVSEYQEYPVVEPIKEADWMWFRGDRVEILKGPDKGKQVCRKLRKIIYI